MKSGSNAPVTCHLSLRRRRRAASSSCELTLVRTLRDPCWCRLPAPSHRAGTSPPRASRQDASFDQNRFHSRAHRSRNTCRTPSRYVRDALDSREKVCACHALLRMSRGSRWCASLPCLWGQRGARPKKEQRHFTSCRDIKDLLQLSPLPIDHVAPSPAANALVL